MYSELFSRCEKVRYKEYIVVFSVVIFFKLRNRNPKLKAEKFALVDGNGSNGGYQTIFCAIQWHFHSKINWIKWIFHSFCSSFERCGWLQWHPNLFMKQNKRIAVHAWFCWVLGVVDVFHRRLLGSSFVCCALFFCSLNLSELATFGKVNRNTCV